MLDELAVGNLGILRNAHIEPGPGLVVLTGETGAGKTLLLGALRLLLGGTARKDQIGPHDEEVRVEGRFMLGDGETTATRRITESRGRAYLDGAMVPAKVLAETLASSVELVGQHDALSLNDSSVIRQFVDDNLGRGSAGVLDAYRTAFEGRQRLFDRQVEIGGDLRSLEREIEMLDHQAGEIDDAGFELGDDDDLARRADRLRNAGAIAEAIDGAVARLEDDRGAVDALGGLADDLLRAARLDASLRPLADQAAELVAGAGALAGELRRVVEDLDHDAGSLDQVEQRLGLLADLRRKYGDSLEAILGFGQEAAERAATLRQLVEDAAGITEAIAKAEAALDLAASELTALRKKAAAKIAKSARGHLIDLGFSDPIVAFEFSSAPPANHGADRIVLAFASDASLTAVPVSRGASGGELSRLVLSVRLAAATTDAPVLAFDEIDAGLGGSTALAMGAKLADLATGRQVLCVTHLPQVAAHADTHFVVDRDGATASVRRVDDADRLDELTRMLSGLADSDTGREHAAELLEAAATRNRG